MAREQFYGYVFDEDGRHHGAKPLNGDRDMKAFILQREGDAPKLIVTDALDRCVFESRNGEVIFPRPDQEERLKPLLRCLVVEPHQPPREALIENKLEAMQEIVDGLIEFVYMDDDTLLVCNEEGKMAGLEGNRRVGDDIIAGTFFVCADDGDNVRSLSDEQMKQYAERFQEDETFTPEEVESKLKFEFYPL